MKRIFNILRKSAAATCALVIFSLALVGQSGAQVPVNTQPVPAAWQALGLAKWPERSSQLGLICDDIVLAGKVAIKLRSNVQFTQRLVLYSHPPGAPETMTELANIALSPKTGPELALSITATATQDLVLLAQTPSGWFMVNRQLKVGRKP